MRYQITLGNNQVCYDLQRKQVKNINLRVRDGRISVSAPPNVPQKEIEGFLLQKADWILRALARTRVTPKPPRAYLTGETLLLFGIPHRLTVRQGSTNEAVATNGEMILTVREPENAALRARTVEAFLKKLCADILTALCHRVYPMIKPRGISFPSLRFRTMKSRWGSCHTKKGILTFNYALVELPLAFSEYVVVHEFCHFFHADHSAAFYREVERILPDWKARRALGKKA